ncbi:hypothetical protein [Pontibacter sp. H249]|uniref:hypothetical protein n=1 Tax=Pontibacter sp. H249 TaxID=3133420 RepID=UPI0030C0747E
MIKKVLKTIFTLLLILIVGFTIWWNMPCQVQRSEEIETGNILVSSLQDYQEKNGILPETGDWKALEEIGFDVQETGTIPDYQKKSDTTFSLIYLEGFDGPYLTYESEKGEWTIK